MAEDEYDPLRKRTTVRGHQGDVLRSRRKRQFKQMMNEGPGELDFSHITSSRTLSEWLASEDFWRLVTFECCNVVGFFGAFFPHVAPSVPSSCMPSRPFSGLPLNRTSVHMPEESANVNCAIHLEV